MRKARPALITTSALILSSALNFIGVMVWVRILTPAEFGLYALVTAAALLLNAIGFDWLRNISARMLYKGDSASLIDEHQAAIVFRLVGIVAIILAVLSCTLSALDFSSLGIPSAWLPLSALFAVSEMAIGLVNIISRTRKLYWQYFFSTILRSLMVVIFGYCAVSVFHLGVFGLVCATAIAQLTAATAVIGRDKFWRAVAGDSVREAMPYRTIRPFLVMGAPLVASSGLMYLGTIIDRYLISNHLGQEAVGLYVAPLDLTSKTIGLLMLAINIIFFPEIVRTYEDEGRSSARSKLQQNLALQVVLLSAPLLVIALFPKQFCFLLLGSRYVDQSSLIVFILSLAICIRTLTTNFLMLIFQLEKKMNYMMLPPAISILTVVPVGIVGMHYAGLYGMAVAVLFTQIFTWMVTAMVTKSIFEINIISGDVMKIVGSAAVIYLTFYLYAVPETVLGAIIGSAVALTAHLAVLAMLRLDLARSLEAMVRAKFKMPRR